MAIRFRLDGSRAVASLTLELDIHMKRILSLSLGLILGLSAWSADKKPVKVFVLVGQSNLEGRGFPEPLAWQVSQKKYRERYTHFIKDGDFEAFTRKVAETTDPNDRGKTPTYLWSTRHDVWINYLGKHGDLTVGYGAPRVGFGPEFNFGHVVGNHFDEQVFLIKASWGGRALARGFLPPSSMLSDEEYSKLAAAQNAENKAWNDAEPAKIEAVNKRIAEENKTAEKKRRLRTFKPREMVTAAQYKEQFGKDYSQYGQRGAWMPERTGQAVSRLQESGLRDQGLCLVLGLERPVSGPLANLRKEHGQFHPQRAHGIQGAGHEVRDRSDG